MFIVERPKITDCLGPSGKVFRLTEGENIKSICSFYGKPVPSLLCALLDVNGQQVRNTVPSEVKTNYTSSNIMLLSNVRRTAKTIRCKAYHPEYAEAVEVRKVLVYRKYHGMLHCYLCLFC